MALDELDGLQPNTQKPGLSKLGTSSNPWDEIYTGAVYTSGAKVPGVYTATVDFVGGTALTVTHNLNNSNPIVQVYGSGLNQQLPFGSGMVNQALPAPQSIITSISGISASAVGITVTSGVAGAKVVVFG